MNLKTLIFFLLLKTALPEKFPNFRDNRSTIVQLFEWKWLDIARECEEFLQHKKYAGVQISPPNENLIIENRPWYERYQPISYKILTRSGNEEEFIKMTNRCNAVGVRIYADVVINHMTAGNGIGTGGSTANIEKNSYSEVPYNKEHFHENCLITDYQNSTNVRYCRLVGLLDLNQGNELVRQKVVNYMNHLIDMGVAGFRIDAAKHMSPKDLNAIYKRLKNLNETFGFRPDSRPFIYQEVIDLGNEAIKAQEYTKFGRVIEFKYSAFLNRVFSGKDRLKWLVNFGPDWGLLQGSDSVAFIDNHDNQRQDSTLSFKNPKQYKMAIAFMLAYPYGLIRIMSSYFFNTFAQGPPADAAGNVISPQINPDDTCSNGWVCEHRWREIYGMVKFKNVVYGTLIDNWWTNNGDQIAFSRGAKGFIAFTNWGDINQEIQTSLPLGVYCDVISGKLLNGTCTGKFVNVNNNGRAFISLGALEFNGVLAIHVQSKI